MLRAPFALALLTISIPAATPDPTIQKIVREVSEERVADTMRKLTSFETRGNFSDPAQANRGIGAARRWISEQFRGYDPRLQVSFDSWKVKKQGTRILRDVEVVNVVAVLPGTTNPSQRIVIGGHYDSMNIVRKPNAPEVGAEGSEPAVDDIIDFEKSIEAAAPGASDDGSGTAVVMELARVMSKYSFEKTIVFIAFGGEEIGLVGSSLYADKAHSEKQQIEAMLNNDIVGNDVAGDGRSENGSVRVFSDDPADSVSRELARYVRSAAQTYVPAFRTELIFRADRFSRGGDHTPFAADGFAAIRFTTPVENLGVQHTAEDTFEKASPRYTANVARVNAAAAASLALAPSSPQVNRETLTGASKGRLVPNLARGKSKYDATLRWKDPHPPEDLAGYAVVMRATTAPLWDHEVFVGKVNEYTIPSLSIDDIVLGVKAIDRQGHESLVSPYIAPLYPRKPIVLSGDPAGAK
ncbi:MAG: M28 family peptidase [Terriglobia bacterium]